MIRFYVICQDYKHIFLIKLVILSKNLKIEGLRIQLQAFKIFNSNRERKSLFVWVVNVGVGGINSGGNVRGMWM